MYFSSRFFPFLNELDCDNCFGSCWHFILLWIVLLLAIEVRFSLLLVMSSFDGFEFFIVVGSNKLSVYKSVVDSVP